MSLRSGSVALRQLNPIERGRKEAVKIFFLKKETTSEYTKNKTIS